MPETLAVQLDRVDEAIAAIVSGAQSITSGGDTVNKPSLADLRLMQKELRMEIDRSNRGRTTVAEV